MIKMQKTKGFSLIELLLSITILFLLFTMVNQGFFQKQRSMQFEIAVDDLYDLLYEAREYSRHYKAASLYGVLLESDQYTLFKGETYVSTGALLTNQLEGFLKIDNLNLNGGGSEILFEKNTGETNNYGSFDLVSDDGEIMKFEINTQGFINTTYSAS